MKTLIVMVATTALVAIAATAYALWGQSTSIQGTVGSVASDKISVTPDSQSSPVDVQVKPETQFKDVNSVNELQSGDQVKIEYKDEGGQKVATSVQRTSSASTTGGSMTGGASTTGGSSTMGGSSTGSSSTDTSSGAGATTSGGTSGAGSSPSTNY